MPFHVPLQAAMRLGQQQVPHSAGSVERGAASWGLTSVLTPETPFSLHDQNRAALPPSELFFSEGSEGQKHRNDRRVTDSLPWRLHQQRDCVCTCFGVAVFPLFSVEDCPVGPWIETVRLPLTVLGCYFRATDANVGSLCLPPGGT